MKPNIKPTIKQIKIPHVKKPYIKELVPSLLLLLVSRGAVMGMSPFALGFFGATYNKRTSYISVLASLVGIATSLGISSVPKYLIALSSCLIFFRFNKRQTTLINSLGVGLSLLLGGAVLLLADFRGVFDIFLLITEAITSSLMYIIFIKAKSVTDNFGKRRGMTDEEYIASSITVGIIIAGMGGIEFRGISLSAIMATYVVLISSLNASLTTSACTGLAIGFTTSMATGGSVVMMGIYGFCALFASFMNNYKRAGCFIGYISAMSVMLIYTQASYSIPQGILNAVIGGGLFLLTPRVVGEYMRSFFTKSMQVEAVSPTNRMREYLSMRLSKTAQTFESLYECFFSMSEGRLKKYSDDMGIILDETAERVCEDCKMCGKCWQADFRKTYKNMLELIGIIESEGILNIDNVPPHFGEKCERTQEFIRELNHVYELYKRDVLRRGDAITTRNLISMQYDELNKLFLSMSRDVEEGFDFIEDKEEEIVTELDKVGIVPYEISVIEGTAGVCEVYLRLPITASHSVVEGVLSHVLERAVSFTETENGLSKYTSGAVYTVEKSLLQLPRDGFGVNGDSVAIFTTDDAKFYCIIADGMGSGSEAQYESSAACRLLTSFLRAGFGIKTALGVLNSSMCLNMENEMYTTIDLLCIDLYTAQTQMYKIGSAESLVLNNGEVKAVSSSSPPAGILADVRLDKKSIVLKEGDTIVMMSDGITESGCSVSRTDWVKKIMVKPHEDMDSLAKEIIDTAIEKNGNFARDDMSVVAIRLKSL